MRNQIIALLLIMGMFIGGCTTVPQNGDPGAIAQARQKLEELSEPTFESLEVFVHDYSAKGVTILVAKKANARVPIRIFANSALSILEKERITMLDVVALSNSMDGIGEGEIKLYVDLAWSLLEANGVIRRDDLTAILTEREQRLLISLFKGMYLGTGDSAEVERVLDGYGPRYESNTPVEKPAELPAGDEIVPPTGSGR